ncbi:MAG: mucin-desulfating sulfatase [Verrucomicrobia bacterium]|nr:MAG: mucin-desulfating sulfatase [Verrucomicrobiota bacterium]
MSLAQWFRFHADDVDIAEAGEVDLLFVGDSITHGWDGQPLWQEAFGRWRPANFGIGGDTTSNVLWRLRHGGIGNLAPKVVVLMIGTNNFWVNHNEPAEVADGIAAVVHLLRASFPRARILVLSIFPRDEFPDGENRLKVEAVNRLLPRLDDGEHVFVRDIGAVFLEPDGRLSKAVMPDFLHPSAEGYRRWAEAMLPIITPWLE